MGSHPQNWGLDPACLLGRHDSILNRLGIRLCDMGFCLWLMVSHLFSSYFISVFIHFSLSSSYSPYHHPPCNLLMCLPRPNRSGDDVIVGTVSKYRLYLWSQALLGFSVLTWFLSGLTSFSSSRWISSNCRTMDTQNQSLPFVSPSKKNQGSLWTSIHMSS